MAYNQRLLLQRIIEIKGIVHEARRKGQSQVWVYENLIRDRYYISFATFNNYLARNARRELKELDAKDEAKRNQLSFSFDQSASAV